MKLFRLCPDNLFFAIILLTLQLFVRTYRSPAFRLSLDLYIHVMWGWHLKTTRLSVCSSCTWISWYLLQKWHALLRYHTAWIFYWEQATSKQTNVTEKLLFDLSLSQYVRASHGVQLRVIMHICWPTGWKMIVFLFAGQVRGLLLFPFTRFEILMTTITVLVWGLRRKSMSSTFRRKSTRNDKNCQITRTCVRITG